MSTLKLGAHLEALAAEYLQSQGLLILHRNFRSRMGEIDLIGQHNEELVFIEVRYRKNNDFGSAKDSVNRTKQKKIIKTAKFFLQTREWANQLPCRFDVIAISQRKETKKHLEWIQDAFHVV